MAQVRIYKEDSLAGVKPNSVVAVKVPNENKFELWITDLQGVPYPLKTISGGGGVIQTITNTDGNITITGSNNLTINIAPSLLSVINSALQVGSNISDLNNDAGYITIETDPIFQASEASLFVAGDKANLDNQSGINSGDETTLSIQTKRPLKTVNGESLEGSGNVQIDYNDLNNLPTIPTVITNHSGLILDDGTNPHGTTKSDVSLGNVDNTSDLNKPISTATQTALDLKLDKVTTTGVERVYTINPDGSQSTKAVSELGGSNATLKQSLFYFHDFVRTNATDNTNSIWSNTGSSGSGTSLAQQFVDNPNHFGNALLTVGSGTTSFVRYFTASNDFKSTKGLFHYFEIAFPEHSRPNTLARFGFTGQQGFFPVNNGAIFEVDGAGNLVFITGDNNVRTNSATYSISPTTNNSNPIYYKCLVIFEEANQVRFIVRQDNNTLVANVLITTNVPIDSRRFGGGIVCGSTTDASALPVAIVDKMILGIDLPPFLNFML